MFEVSSIIFSLLIEGFILLLVLLSVLLYFQYKRKSKDKVASQKLVKKIKDQAKARKELTSTFLREKFGLEGKELEKVMNTINKSELKFMQTVINMYLHRDDQTLMVMDENVAELIETYKDLSPKISEVGNPADLPAGEPDPALIEELNELRENNERLSDELSITKKTMGNMIAEFGNMFGGGKESTLDADEVLNKVSDIHFEADGREDVFDAASVLDESMATDDMNIDDVLMENVTEPPEDDQLQADLITQEIMEQEQVKKKENKPVEIFDEGIDDLMDGIDLSDDTL